MKALRRLVLAVLLAGVFGPWLRAFVFIEGMPAWPDGTVTLELQLGTTPAYYDGTTPNSTAIEAAGAWNPYMGRVRLAYVDNSSASKSRTNGKNNVFFDSAVYGTAFGDGVLAVTVARWTSGGAPIEADVVVNSSRTWDSYRGPLWPGTIDIRRVLAHEFGHVLGLDHPDEHGQTWIALMNSHVSYVDAPVFDDQEGIAARYGRGTGNPATAPTITDHPVGAAYVAGQEVILFCWANGTEPLRYQWFKNGAEIPGATSRELRFTSVQLTDAGVYFIRVSNDVGSVDSREATLSISAAGAPVITSHPQGLTVEVGASFNIWGSATSNAPIEYRWTRDGSVVPGETNPFLSRSAAALTDAGEYRLVATTPGGTATSNPAIVQVVATRPPVFSVQPSSISALVGDIAHLSGWANAAQPATYQWTRDGMPIPGATESTLYFNPVSPEHAGIYHLIATNSGGSVTSAPATVYVAPRPPPPVVGLPNLTRQVGTSARFSVSMSTQGMTFQWFKNGVPIPGATRYEFEIPSVGFADSGDYFVVATNGSGSTTSRSGVLRVIAGTTAPTGAWKEARVEGPLVYFLFSSPSRIARFDLTSETWLPSAPLAVDATAMTIISPSTAAVVYARTVALIDIPSGQSTVLATLDHAPTGLATHSGRIYVLANDASGTDRRMASLNASAPGPVTWTSPFGVDGAGFTIAPKHNRAFFSARWHGGLVSLDLLADGTFGSFLSTTNTSDLPRSTRTFVRPDGDVAFTSTGIAATATDLRLVRFLKAGLDDIAFGPADITWCLRGREVSRHDTNLSETEHLTLSRDAHLLAIHGGAVFAFTQPGEANGPVLWEKRSADELVPTASTPVQSAALLNYTADDVFVDRDGVLYLHSRQHANLFRWSIPDQRYLETIPLRGRACSVAYAEALHRVYLGYPDGSIYRIDLGYGFVEEPFAQMGWASMGLWAAASHLIAPDINSSSDNTRVFDEQGNVTAQRIIIDYSASWVWDPHRRRVYHLRDNSSPNDLEYTQIAADGTITGSRDTAHHGDIPFIPPVRLSPAGDLVIIGTGAFFDPDTMAKTHALPHAIQDAAWFGPRLFTANNTLTGARIERWSADHATVETSRELTGRVVRLLAQGEGRLVAVTVRSGRIHLTLLDADLNVRNHFENTPDLTKVVLANLSTRAEVGTDGDIIIAGFVVKGTQPKRVLVRAVGPGLNRFGVSGTLADPVLKLISDAGLVAENDNWSTPDGESLKLAFREVFAFGLADASNDAALVATLSPGKYTAQVSGKDGGRGVALVEAYDLDADAGERRLINISTRAVVGVGDKVLIPGLVVDGTAPKRLLIRAVGPELTRFGVGGVLADPKLEVIDADDAVVAANDNWGDDNTEVTAAATTAASAFRLAAGSRDAALVVTLPPGSYTIVARGVGDTTGVALVEVYEVP